MFTVLHVEHNRFYHAIVKNLIANNEINYISVKSPAEGLETLKTTKVNLIVTGLIFEDVSGEEFIKEHCSSKYKAVPIIVMSSNDDDETILRLKKYGIANYINKNASLEILKANINKYANRNSTYEEIKKFKIAVLENNELELTNLKKMFETNFVSNVHYYSNGETFIESKEKYNLYILDYKLPKVPGEYIISVLRERNPKAIILAITSVDNGEIISQILSAGANDYIKKPYTEDIILSRIHINTRNYTIDDSLEFSENALNISDKKIDDLLSKETIYKRLNEEVKRVRRHKGNLSIAYLGIDKYEQMKVGYGQSYTDEIVKTIGEIIKDHIRLTDIMGYVNDKEFLILLPSTDLQGGVIMAEKIRCIIEETDFGREELTVTISGGVSELREEDEPELIARASELMHQSKFYGGNKIEHTIEKENMH